MQWPGWILHWYCKWLMDISWIHLLSSFLSMSCRHGCHLLWQELVLPVDTSLLTRSWQLFLRSVQLTRNWPAQMAHRFVSHHKVSSKRTRAVWFNIRNSSNMNKINSCSFPHLSRWRPTPTLPKVELKKTALSEGAPTGNEGKQMRHDFGDSQGLTFIGCKPCANLSGT